MQRFKRFTMAKGNVNAHGQPVIFGQRWGYAFAHPAANTAGKFVYGANGTLTQAARDRADGMVSIRLIAEDRSFAKYAAKMLWSARRGGFRLPA